MHIHVSTVICVACVYMSTCVCVCLLPVVWCYIPTCAYVCAYCQWCGVTYPHVRMCVLTASGVVLHTHMCVCVCLLPVVWCYIPTCAYVCAYCQWCGVTYPHVRMCVLTASGVVLHTHMCVCVCLLPVVWCYIPTCAYVCAYCQWCGVTYPHVRMCVSSRLEWSALVDPVIDKACNGFVVSPHLARALHYIKDEPLIANSTIFKNTFYNNDQLAKVHMYVCILVKGT